MSLYRDVSISVRGFLLKNSFIELDLNEIYYLRYDTIEEFNVD